MRVADKHATTKVRELMDYAEYNRRAWDRQVELGNEWTVPVSEDIVAAARDGVWQ